MIKKLITFIFLCVMLSNVAAAEVNTTSPISNGEYTDINTLHLLLIGGLICFVMSIFILLVAKNASMITVLLSLPPVFVMYYASLKYIDGSLVSCNEAGIYTVIRDGAMANFMFYGAILLFAIFCLQCYDYYKVLTYEEPKTEKYYWEE